MKTITTIFESILGQDDTFVWTPTDGPTEFARGWDWKGVDGASRGWDWKGLESI
ncbi:MULTISPECIES: hypothetical protein [unclassified Phycicoccus]|uniref:hypothetical protein n=1 Tax=unclassified Phycicoccus TaxID=2637926 RepID=UPI000B191A41|nr:MULTISPECIES: hypothetical protein [unclassified Phycicoccus]